MTNKLFAMLNCREISETELILVADYEVDCKTAEHEAFQVLAALLIVVFSAGVPIVIMVFMHRSRAAQAERFMTPEWQYITRQVAAEFAHDDIQEIRQCITDVQLGNQYGFLIKAFKPGACGVSCLLASLPTSSIAHVSNLTPSCSLALCVSVSVLVFVCVCVYACLSVSPSSGFFFWECLDMLRKLLLVGLLTVVGRGSTFQVCVGMWTCLIFLVAHVATMPFRFYEDNVLKASSEFHLFLTLMLVLVLKVDLSGEFLVEHGYDIILTTTFLVAVPGVALVAIVHKWWGSERIARQHLSNSLEAKREPCDALFRRLDVDGDGTLTLHEIKKGISKIRAETGIELKAKEIMAKAKTDGDKKVSADEFFEWFGSSMDDRRRESNDISASFTRFRLGRDFVTDREVLGEYFAKKETEISDDYHIFISYRVASERTFAKQLCDELSKETLAATGQRLRIFLDQISLKDGERWCVFLPFLVMFCLCVCLCARVCVPSFAVRLPALLCADCVSCLLTGIRASWMGSARHGSVCRSSRQDQSARCWS